MRDNVFENSGVFTTLEPRRILEKAEVPYINWYGHDVNVNWWVVVIKIEGKDQYGNFTGTDCSAESEHTYFPLFWSP
jgi:hypothetical protein